MSSLNKILLIGRIGKDPEYRKLDSGNSVCNFSVATSETYKDKATGEKKEITEWHNIVIWGSLAEVATKYLHKGDQVYLEGKKTTRSYEKDGTTRYVTEIVVNNMVMLGGKKEGNSSGEYHPSEGNFVSPKQTSSSPIDDDGGDSLPF